jgi:hypothetical protein
VANVIEVLIVGKNTSGTSITAAESQLRGLQATTGRMAGAMAQATSGMSGMGGQLTSVGSAAGPAGAAIAALAGVVVGLGTAIYKATEALTGQVEQLQRVANQTGVSTQNIQVLQRITQESGGDVGTLTSAFSFLNRAIAENNPMLRSLGITTRDTFSAFMQLAQVLSESKDAANSTKVAQELLGRGGKDLLGTVKELVAKFPEMRSEMTALGLVMSNETIDGINRVDAKLESAGRKWEALFQRLKIAAAPVAGFLADVMTVETTQSGPLSGLDATQQDRVQRLFKSAMPEMPKDFILAMPTLEKMEEAFAGAAGAAKRTADEALAAAIRAKDTAEAQAKAAEAAKLHAEAVRQVAAAMGVTTAEASRLLDVYERVEKNRAMDKLREKIVAAQEAAKSLNTLIDEALAKPAELPGLRKTGPIGTFKPTGTVEGPDPRVLEAMRAAAPAQQMRDMLDNWREFTEQVFSGAELLNSGLQTVQQGLTAGFQTAFASMLSGAMSFARAMRSIFASLANAIIAEMARLMAMQAIKTLVTIATGGVPITSNAGVVAGIPSPVPAVGDVGAVPMGATINNVTINALDARSVLQQTVSPSGALRLTNTRMAELAAVA